MATTKKDTENIWEDLNWMDREELVSKLESIGIACYDHESNKELREALFSAVEQGDLEL
jgi:hypothetical protein